MHRVWIIHEETCPDRDSITNFVCGCNPDILGLYCRVNGDGSIDRFFQE